MITTSNLRKVRLKLALISSILCICTVKSEEASRLTGSTASPVDRDAVEFPTSRINDLNFWSPSHTTFTDNNGGGLKEY